MAHLTSPSSFQVIKLESTDGSKYYNSYNPQQWNEVQSILSKFGITVLSKYEIEFASEAYKLQRVPKHFGAADSNVFYKDTIIAKATITGSNYCDREAKLTIDLKVLESIYEFQ